MEDEIDIEDLIEEEQCVYTLTGGGYIKRTSASMLSWAMSRPSSRWARSWAFFRSYWVRRMMTCSWKAMQGQ